MRVRKVCKWFLSLCMIFCVSGLPFFQVLAAEYEHQAKRYNVVFVMDNSGSMEGRNGSDPDGWRYEALDLFLGLTTNRGNFIGAVAFNETVVFKAEMKELEGNYEKGKLSQQLEDVPVGGDTNIGAALLEAVKMLDEQGNPELPSAIVLLTDGNTDLDTEEKMEWSETNKKAALHIAEQNHYPIYSICLNKSGKADSKELSSISTATKGEWEEIRHAEDLKQVFNWFYNLIYDTETVTLIDEKIPEHGKVETEFTIPEFGVEEVNIIISTLNYDTTYEITCPSKKYTEEELDDMRISASSFSVIKVIEPEAGAWKVTVYGIPGDDIKITMVYNADYRIQLEHEGEEQLWNLNDEVELRAFLIDGNEQLRNSQAYQKNPAKLSIDHDGKTEWLDMSAGLDGFVARYKINHYGTYSFRVSMPVEGMREESRELKIRVENHTPQAESGLISWNIRNWKFGEKTYSYETAPMVSDVEDDNLQYEIVDANAEKALNGMEIDLTSDGCLRLTKETEPKRIFAEKLKQECVVRIRVKDTQGAYCEFDVNIHWYAVNYLLGRIAVVIIAAVLVLIPVLFWRSRHKKFNGEMTVRSFDDYKGEYGVLKTISEGRGRVALHLYLQDGCGVNLQKIWLQATGKNYVYLISAKKYYSTDGTKKKKKFRLYDGEEFTVSNAENLMSGIKVTYHYNGMH